MGFIIFLAAIIAFYVYAGKKWKDETKRRFKIVVCGISLLCTVFLLLICISGAKDLYETEKDRSLSARMDSVEYELRRGDYIGAITSMQVNHYYEEVFSYIWERCEMYMTRNYCALYKKAAEENGFDLVVSGEPALFYLRIANDNSLMLHQEWIAECVSRGLFLASHHNHFMNAAVTDEDITLAADIANDAFAVVAARHPDKLNK